MLKFKIHRNNTFSIASMETDKLALGHNVVYFLIYIFDNKLIEMIISIDW